MRSTGFWKDCAKRANRGTSAFANDWQWLYGAPIVSAITAGVISYMGKTNVTTGNAIADGLIAGAAAYAITWAVAFLIRLYKTAPLMHEEQRCQVEALEERLRPKLEFVGLRGRNNPQWIYDVEIKNAGSVVLDNCLVKIESIDVTDGTATGFTFPFVLTTEEHKTYRFAGEWAV